MEAYRELIKENIDYDYLLHDHPYDKERLDGFVELMAETCCSNRKSIRINQGDMSTEVVKSRFLKLDSGHIQYVMDCLDRNTTLIGNIRAYTLSALFNAPVTISQYYTNRVRHDMAKGMYDGSNGYSVPEEQKMFEITSADKQQNNNNQSDAHCYRHIWFEHD